MRSWAVEIISLYQTSETHTKETKVLLNFNSSTTKSSFEFIVQVKSKINKSEINMSSLQLLLDLADSLDSMSSPYYHSDFGLGLSPYQIHRHQSPRLIHLPLALASRLEPLERHLKESGKVSSIGKDGFQVCMDVQQFKPSELSVKVVDNTVVVEGKHEEREDNHGFISRHFVRRYALPKDYDSDKLVSTLSSDGVLTLSIPKPAIEEKPAEKLIQIQQTGPAHLNVKENAEEQPKEAAAKDKK